ncbi:MAG: Trm112 family protein [Phycisphaerales bacterium JB064]
MKSEPIPQDGPIRLPDALRCPLSRKPLELEPDGQWVRVVGEPVRYPVRQGIPVLVPAAAQRIAD